MAYPKIESFKRIVPMIYAYNTPGVVYNDGWTKIGYTESQTVEQRIAQQTHTAGIRPVVAWTDNAIYKDGSGETFKDHDFHAFLTNTKYVKRREGTEWFEIDGPHSLLDFNDFASRRTDGAKQKLDYKLREEQKKAVEVTSNHFKYENGNKFLWNAKPRFGKTLTSYDLVKQLNCKNVLIVTNRPSIANSWVEDFNKFIGWQGTYAFVSETDSLKGKEGVLSYNQFVSQNPKFGEEGQHKGMIAFESLQGLKGSIYGGGEYDKLKWLFESTYDLLIIDESQEGVYTFKTSQALKHIKADRTLYLSGTPFKQIASNEFNDDEIFTWSYADEQSAKESWDKEEFNPYENLPKMNMFTYELSNMIYDKISQGARITDGYTVDFAFDLNAFFETKDNGRFVHEDEVKKFIKALYTQEKYPFSSEELRQELPHTLWYLNRVDSCKALATLLKKDPVFREYEIILAAGNGKLDDEDAVEKAFDRAKKTIHEHEKTITLTVGQLTVGVTIPEWCGVLMLCNLKDPSPYMQAAFRAQNPCKLSVNGKQYRKENAYIFDFDPSRTLILYDEFANNLSASTASGKGTAKDHEDNIKRMLNFFPVLGEDTEGHMVELDPKQVLSIPRKLKSQEVVRSGFMNNYLFSNISNIFSAPSIIQGIVNRMEMAQEEKGKKKEKSDIPSDLPINDDGDIEITNEIAIGKAQDLFGDKIYEELEAPVDNAVNETFKQKELDKITEGLENVKNTLKDFVKEAYIKPAEDSYQLKPSVSKKLESKINEQIENTFKEKKADYEHQIRIAKAEHDENLAKATTQEAVQQVEKKHSDDLANAFKSFTSDVQAGIEAIKEESKIASVQHFEKAQAEEKKKSVEEDVRKHLRGFSRTIPSFIMAYGDDKMRLQNFDDYTDDDVFLAVTSIEEKDFRFLRDGGYYIELSDGTTKYLDDSEISSHPDAKYFEGHLFDEVVFDDSIKEFLRKKKELNNYFDESLKEDIFDYIPPQRTNQIYVPKNIAKKMVDLLEQEDPGCYDDPDKTFIDTYMKSGLYITEIVKRLYNSPVIKEKFPDDKDRLKHIFEKQVYGLAPTKIIYLIAINFILGFDENSQTIKHNFRCLDAVPYAMDGTLSEKLDELFGGNNNA